MKRSLLSVVFGLLSLSAFSNIRMDLIECGSVVSSAWEAGNKSRFESELRRYKRLQDQFVNTYRPEMTAYTDAMSSFLYDYSSNFFYAWNFGDRDEAIDCLRRLSSLWKRCSREAMRSAMQVIDDFADLAEKGRLPDRFERSDYDGSRCNLLYYLTAPGYDAFGQAMDSQRRSWQALGAAFEARCQTEAWIGEIEGSICCLRAELDYQEKTNRKFDPDKRPSADSIYREPWDRCKRIHDIFSGSSAYKPSRIKDESTARIESSPDSRAVIASRFSSEASSSDDSVASGGAPSEVCPVGSSGAMSAGALASGWNPVEGILSFDSACLRIPLVFMLLSPLAIALFGLRGGSK